MNMKKLINSVFLATAMGLLFTSCDRNDDNEIKSVDLVKIDSVKIAQDTMDIYTVQTIKTYSTYADGCHGFYGYDYVRNGLTRNVAAYQYSIKGNCTQATRVGVNGFNFRPEEKGSYTFKFWNGKDNSNNDIWIEKTVVVQ